MTDYDRAFDLAATAPMKLSITETFAEYAARVWPTREETGLPEEPLARFIFNAAAVYPPRNQFSVR